MKDLIERQAVDKLIDELARAISDERCFMSRGRSIATIMQDILDLPTVSTEKTGYWVYKTIRGEKVPCCSRCGLDNGTGYEFDFCPECGAKMIEPQESEEDKE